MPDRDTMEGAIAEIRTAVLDGDSYYFIRLEDSEVFVTVNAAENPLAVILNVGDRVRLSYEIGDNSSILTGASVELLAAAEPAEAATPESAAAA